jgi:hypothetical protein
MPMPSYVDDPRGHLPIPAYALIAATILSVLLSLIVIKTTNRPARAIETPAHVP